MEETKFQQITIKPIHGTDGAPSRYRLSVDGFPPHLWTEPGIYNTPEEVVASFYPPLRVEYQARDSGIAPERQGSHIWPEGRLHAGVGRGRNPGPFSLRCASQAFMKANGFWRLARLLRFHRRRCHPTHDVN